MYRSYWGLRENPFSNTFNPRFFFLTRNQEEAVRKFLNVFTNNKAVMMLLGPTGVGKTHLCKLIASQMTEAGVNVAHMITPRLSAEHFCKEVARKLGLPNYGRTEISTQELYDSMSDKDEDIPSLLILDEAQAITDEMAFDAIRIMLDFDKNGRLLHTLLISGDDSLVGRIHNNESLNQRISTRHRLLPLTERESSEYVDFRLKAAGAVAQIFDPEAKKSIFEISRGLPRIVNALCDTAMVIAADERFLKIDKDIVGQARERISSIT